ncbi:MAG: extracellular solute-binding protein [Acidimicrobiia bacterium]
MFHDPAEFRDEAVAAFNDQFPNIKVELQQVPDDFPTAILTMAAAGTLPEVARVWEPHVLEFARAGQVIDLEPFIDAEPTFNPEDFLEVFWNFPVIEGKRYGVADGWNGHQTFFNKDMFDEAGVDYPQEGWAWDDYVAAARQLSRPEEQRWGSDTVFVGWLHWNYKLIWQNGGQVYDEAYTQAILDSPEAAEGIQFWADLLREGQIMPPPPKPRGWETSS